MSINQSNTIRALAVVAILALGSGPAPAQVLFTDNFESVSVGAVPDNGAQPGGWTNKLTPGTSFLQVTNLPSAPQGTQVLQIHRNLNDVGIGASLALAMSNQEFVVSLFAQTPAGPNINVFGGFYSSINLTTNTADLLTMGDASGGANNALNIFYRNRPGTSQHAFYWHSGTSATYTDTGLGWTAGQWDHVSLRILPGLGVSGADAFVLSVSNLVSGIVQTTGRITFDGPTVPGSVALRPNITRAYFGQSASNQDYYLDDVIIAVPEPTVAMLVGLGGLVLLRRRN